LTDEKIDPALVGQVLLKTEPKDFIKGEDSFDDELDTEGRERAVEKTDQGIDDDPDEPAKLTHELEELIRKDKDNDE